MKHAKKFKNVIKPCLLPYDDNKSVISQIPPPPLHLLIGAVGAIMNFIVKVKGESPLTFTMKFIR